MVGCCASGPGCSTSTYQGGCGYSGSRYAGVTVLIVSATNDNLMTACMLASDLIPGAGLPTAMAAVTGFGGVSPIACSASANPAGCNAMGQNTLNLLSGSRATTSGFPTAPTCPRYTTGATTIYTPTQYSAYLTSIGATMPSSTARARQDPHLWFAHGGRADFRGEHNAVYTLLSAKNTSMNVLIQYADMKMHNTLVHGSYMHAAYWTLRTNETGRVIHVEFNVTEVHGGPSTRDVGHRVAAFVSEEGVQGRKAIYNSAHPFKLENLQVSMTNKTVTVTTGKWVLSATVTQFLYAHHNEGKKLLNVKIEPASGYTPDADEVAPHGIVGQSYDGDGVGINGATDAPLAGNWSADEVTTKAQAEGAIEGTIFDYKMPSPFATSFKFSRFDAVAAAPRDVSKLSGERVRVEVAHMRGVGASSEPHVTFAMPSGNSSGWSFA